VRWLTGWPGADHIVSTNDPLDDIAYDVHAPIFDLPYRFGTDLNSIPSRTYLPLPAPSNKTRLPNSDRKKIGIVWSGQAQNVRDPLRSLTAGMFVDLFTQSGFHFTNLTRECTEQDRALLAQHNVTDLSPTLHDFRDTAEVIGQLDLLITCDTAAAHLAGAMGKPCWILLPFAPDWRWGYAREDSPWYPSARLFRQHTLGDWKDVLARVKSAITAL
jgi:ADP-heptose:LPS heptosyltransferase